MVRLRKVALCTLVLTGCLDPLTDDQPGYSQHILERGSEVKSIAEDPVSLRRIDMNDGISMGKAGLKSGFAVGVPVKYWELGSGRGTAVPAYQLARCGADNKPLAENQPDHPLLIENLPGDSDYTQIWGIYYVCVTPSYRGELFTSLAALSDAYDLGLAIEPEEPLAWKFHPVVQDGVELEGAGGEVLGQAFSRGYRVSIVDLGADSDVVTTNGRSVTTGNVYEIVRQGSTKVERVVFGSLGFTPEGQRAEGYAPIWTVVTATITSDAELASFTKESDIATVNMDRSFTKASESVVSVAATSNRITRAVQFSGGQP